MKRNVGGWQLRAARLEKEGTKLTERIRFLESENLKLQERIQRANAETLMIKSNASVVHGGLFRENRELEKRLHEIRQELMMVYELRPE